MSASPMRVAAASGLIPDVNALIREKVSSPTNSTSQSMCTNEMAM